jgi:hypothetical protein
MKSPKKSKPTQKGQLFSGKCYFYQPDYKNEAGEAGYEQRIVLLRASNEDEALSLAQSEAEEYAKKTNSKYLPFVEVYRLFDTDIEFQGVVEVYSLTMYDDSPSEEDFLENYYLTGGNARVEVTKF